MNLKQWQFLKKIMLGLVLIQVINIPLFANSSTYINQLFSQSNEVLSFERSKVKKEMFRLEYYFHRNRQYIDGNDFDLASDHIKYLTNHLLKLRILIEQEKDFKNKRTKEKTLKATSNIIKALVLRKRELLQTKISETTLKKESIHNQKLTSKRQGISKDEIHLKKSAKEKLKTKVNVYLPKESISGAARTESRESQGHLIYYKNILLGVHKNIQALRNYFHQYTDLLIFTFIALSTFALLFSVRKKVPRWLNTLKSNWDFLMIYLFESEDEPSRIKSSEIAIQAARGRPYILSKNGHFVDCSYDMPVIVGKPRGDLLIESLLSNCYLVEDLRRKVFAFQSKKYRVEETLIRIQEAKYELTYLIEEPSQAQTIVEKEKGIEPHNKEDLLKKESKIAALIERLQNDFDLISLLSGSLGSVI